jgi:hypothetical protein
LNSDSLANKNELSENLENKIRSDDKDSIDEEILKLSIETNEKVKPEQVVCKSHCVGRSKLSVPRGSSMKKLYFSR